MLRNRTTMVTILVCVLFFCGSLVLSQTRRTFEITGEGVGYTLLNIVVKAFEGSEKLSPEDFREKINKSIIYSSKESIKARAEGKIDDVFFERFTRVLRVIKLVMANDKETYLLNPLIESEVSKFESVGDFSLSENENVGIGTVAGALAGELISLGKYLDKKSGKTKNQTGKTR